MDIEQIISEAFEKARKKAFEEEKKHPEFSKQKIHALRSQNWVESLAATFRKVYENDSTIRVFSKYYKDKEQRKDFGMNELLYDVFVCRVNYTESPKHKTKLAYIEKALWLVESEMAKDTRQLVYDFNKLVIGDAENKMFVGPINTYNKKQLEIFKKIKVNCNGKVWVAFIPHPINWEEIPKQKLNLYEII